MKTKDFIRKVVRGERTKPGSCSSVFFDGKHLYSYGLHYPLLVNIGGYWVLNDSGFSRTTSKHIGLAGMYADFRMEMSPNDYYSTVIPIDVDSLLLKAEREESRLNHEFSKLRKGAFRKQEYLEGRILEIRKTINFLRSQVQKVAVERVMV